MSYTARYLSETKEVTSKIDPKDIDNMISILKESRSASGRLFFLGVGGSAANASHAVNDFRKIAGMESYAPTDNVGELTARTNDNGWHSVFADWLKGSKLNSKDVVFVLSVGGGNAEKNISPNIVEALKYTKEVGAKVVGIVGRDGGYTAKVADGCVVIPTISADTVTPHTESFQAVVWHLIASHPEMKVSDMKWESTK